MKQLLHQAVAEADLILCLVSADLLALLDPEVATAPLAGREQFQDVMAVDREA